MKQREKKKKRSARRRNKKKRKNEDEGKKKGIQEKKIELQFLILIKDKLEWMALLIIYQI